MGVRKICHFLAAAHFFFGCYYDWNYVKIPTKVSSMGESFGFSGKLKFLTFWNALLQAVFFTICLINDFIGTNDNVPRKMPWIRRFKDIILASLAFPISMFVAVTFWGIYFVDRELILPKALDAFFPTWLNHLMHTNIVIFTLLELVSSFRQYPRRKRGLTILGFVMAAYLIWVHVIFYYTGFWVYPVLEVLNLPLRLVFFLSSLGLVFVLYISGETLNNIVWSKQLKGYKTS